MKFDIACYTNSFTLLPFFLTVEAMLNIRKHFIFAYFIYFTQLSQRSESAQSAYGYRLQKVESLTIRYAKNI
jgi:hypothetical protein